MSIERQNFAVNAVKAVQQYVYDTTAIKCRGNLSSRKRINLTRFIKKGTCTTKHEVLASNLETLGYDVKYLTYPFYWQELPYSYPQEIQDLLDKMPRQNHLALMVREDKEEKLIDVTWDPGLKNAGFIVPRVNSTVASTPLAVVPCSNPVVHSNIVDRSRYVESLWPTGPEHEIIGLFYIALNIWLSGIRQAPIKVGGAENRTLGMLFAPNAYQAR